jgi:hypothetical protein
MNHLYPLWEALAELTPQWSDVSDNSRVPLCQSKAFLLQMKFVIYAFSAPLSEPHHVKLCYRC